VFFHAVARPRPQLVEAPAGLGDADDGHIEVAAFDHRLQRWENLLVSQIARGAEEDQRVGGWCAHRALSFACGFARNRKRASVQTSAVNYF
jgi:hypothetical protein